jgi:WD40 repeat protein
LATVGWLDVRFWDVATGQERGRAQGVKNFAQSVAFSPDGKTLVTAERYSGTLHLWDVPTGALKPAPAGHNNTPYQVSFSPDGRRVASGGGNDGTIYIWDPTTGEALAQVRRGGMVRDCAFSADGRSLFSCWSDDKLVFSDTATGHELYTVQLDDSDRPDTQQSGLSMYRSDDGKALVTFSGYSSKKSGAFVWEVLVTGWDAASGRLLFRRRRAREDLTTAVSPDLKVLAVPHRGSADKGAKPTTGQGPIRLEDLATGEHLLTLPALQGQTWPLAFSLDGRLLATATYGPGENAHVLRLWEVATASEVLALPTVRNTRVAFSPDGRVVAISAPAQEILLWDLRQGNELRRIKGLDSDVSSLAFAPDGGRLVSGLFDNTLLVWDLSAVRKTKKPGGLDAAGLTRAWADLGADARTAFAARGALTDAPEKAVPLLKEHLKPAQPADVQRLRQLLADLDSDRFAVREEARKGLEELGDLATAALRRALAEKPSLEVRRQIEALLEKLHGPVARPATLRAVAVLEDIATPEARQVLASLAAGAPEARLTQQATASLNRLARRSTSPP